MIAYPLTALTTAAARAAGHSRDLDLVPVTVPELLRWLRHTVLPAPARSLEHLLHWAAWRRRHQHQARRAHQLWNNVTAEAVAYRNLIYSCRD